MFDSTGIKSILITLVLTLIFVEITHPQNTENFNVGLFSVVGNNAWSPVPGTQEFRNELEMMWQGTNNGQMAINSLHTYGHYIGDSTFWTNYLSDISLVSDGLKTLADCRFEWIDTNNDSLISQNELDNFINLFDVFRSFPNTDHVLGWYIADEPSAHEFDSVEVNKIYTAIKQRDNRPIYIAEAPGETNYARFLCDILIIDNYFYSINAFTDLATLAMWRYLIPQAREQLISAGRGSTEIHTLLVSGEEIFPDSLNEEYMATHGLTHSAIKRVLELGADGVWFYAWRAGVINEEDAVERWLDQQYYAEAIETEFQDKEFLVTAFNNQLSSKIIVSNIGNGQSPDEGSISNFNDRVDAITSNDFQGSNDLDGSTILNDLCYRLEEGFRSNGDGDDELITAFNNGDIFFNESGNQPDELLLNSIEGNVTAITSGDFDGDGDFEIVTAVQNGNSCSIFLSDDGQAGSINEYQLFSSNFFTVTALTAGDFDTDGRDELVTALSNSQLTESFIYVDDISTTGTAVGGLPWFGPSSEYHITALASGDFLDDNIFRDRLIIALSSLNLVETKIYTTSLNSFSFDSAQVFFGPDNYWHASAMTFGDFTDDNRTNEELLIAFSNSTFDHTAIYKTDDPILNGIGELIYDPGLPSEFFISSMSSASFRESLHPITSVDEEDEVNNSVFADKYILFQNYPNPFNPSTKIKYSIPDVGTSFMKFVQLKVFDLLGNEVARLVNEEKPTGTYEIQFDSANLPSGIYFYQLKAGGFIKAKKMLLLK